MSLFVERLFRRRVALCGYFGQGCLKPIRHSRTPRHCFALSFFLYNPVVRNVIFIALFTGLYAAFGVERILLGRARDGRLAMYILLAVILDTASTSVQPVARTDKQYLIDAGLFLEHSAPEERFLAGDVAQDGSLDLDIGPDASPMSYYSTVQRVSGEHNMAATRVHNYVETAVKLAERDLRHTGRLGSDAAALMEMLNVTRVVCSGSFANGCPKRFDGLVSEGPLGAVVPIPNSGPAVFSQNLVTLAPPAGLEKPMVWSEDFTSDPPQQRVVAIEEFLHGYVGTVRLDPVVHFAASLPVRALPADSGRSLEPDRTMWHPRLVGYSVGLQRVHMTVASDGYGYAQIAHPWYPASRVLINGRRVDPLEGAIDLMVVPIAPGTNEIEIAPVMTPIRVASSAISLVSLLLAIAIAPMIGIHGRARRGAGTG